MSSISGTDESCLACPRSHTYLTLSSSFADLSASRTATASATAFAFSLAVLLSESISSREVFFDIFRTRWINTSASNGAFSDLSPSASSAGLMVFLISDSSRVEGLTFTSAKQSMTSNTAKAATQHLAHFFTCSFCMSFFLSFSAYYIIISRPSQGAFGRAPPRRRCRINLKPCVSSFFILFPT